MIIGAARGIGRAQAVRFAQEGAKVIGIDLCGPVDTVVAPPSTLDDLAERATRVRAVGGRMITAAADVRDRQALRTAIEDGVRAYGGLDIVCATAGITSRGPAVDLPEKTWRTMLDVDLTGGCSTPVRSVPRT